jgi:F-type H+-transporting ATPase subunit epsilon
MADLPNTIHLTVVTRDRKVLEVNCDEVVLPGTDGALGILPGHTPLLAMLRIGVLSYRAGATEQRMVLSWGFAEVLPNRVIVLAENAYLPDEIDASAADRQRLEAERELLTLASHDPAFAAVEAKLEESIAQSHVAQGR